MADNNLTISPDEVDQNATEATQDAAAPVTNQLAEAMWNDQPIDQTTIAQQQQQSQAQQQNADATVTTTQTNGTQNENEQTFDEVDYLKKTFDVESIDAIKAEREELKKLREAKPQDLKFENDKSKQVFELLKAGKVDEVLEIYNAEKRIEKTLSLEVNKDTAEDIIKTGMALKYKDLSQSEINYKYQKEFGLPKEPKQSDTETDEDFEERKSEWESKVRDIEMNKIIEAKLLRPELESSKSKIALPELEQAAGAVQNPTPEDMEKFKKLQSLFVDDANKALNEFSGFTTEVKDKDVNYSVSYAPSKEEKELVGGLIQKFAEEGFNANTLLAGRWLKEDGTINVGQLTKDMLRLYTSDKSDAKIANDAAGQRMEQYLKARKNINIKDVNEGVPNQNIDNKSQSEKLQEQFWN